jgi:molybdenum cofactor cytidylyltransferase
MSESRRYAVIVLAAGGSSRLGSPKQLIIYRGSSLIEHAVAAALACGAIEVIVVLGAFAEEIRSEIKSTAVRLIRNYDWKTGMAGSIQTGVSALPKGIDAAILMTCDQPNITASHLRELGLSEAPIAASSYDGILGVPAAFSRAFFPTLMTLTGDAGAREIIREPGADVQTIAFEGAKWDIDAPEDLNHDKP